MGNRITQTYERFEIQGADGKTSPAFCVVGQRSGSGECASFLDTYAMGAEMLGEAHASEVERQMQQAGLPPGLLQATAADLADAARDLGLTEDEIAECGS